MAKKIPRKHLQKQEPKKIVFIAGIILALITTIIFGCTELSSTEKGLCYSLSTKSYASIPACETEESCYSKVNELFKTNLNYSQENKIYELKNNVARSWLFFNKANTKIKNAGKICQGTNYSALPGELNEAEEYIEQSFLELDNAMKLSFEFVGAEEKYLTEQKVDLIKEEKLYDSLVELRQILTELNTGATNSDSYVSYYLLRAQNFSNSNITKGIPELIEKQPIMTESYDFIQGSILKKIGITTEYWFPTLNTAFENGLDYLSSNLYSQQGIMALKKFPVSEFTKLYSELGGNNTSALKRFANLVNKTSSSLKSTQENINLIWKENETLLKSCNATLSEKEQYSQFDKLYASLLGTKVTNEKETKNKLENITKKILLLREEKSRGLVLLGNEVSELKTISTELKEINLELNIEKENYSSNLSNACDELAKTIKNETMPQNESLAKLIYQTQYDSSKTLSSAGKEKLTYCAQLQKETILLNSAKLDYTQFEAQRKDATKECFTYLKKIFSSIELNELKNELDELAKTEVTKENLSDFLYSCENIRRQVDYIAYEDELVQSCEEEVKFAEENLSRLKQIQSLLVNPTLTSTTENYFSRIYEYKKYFEQNGGEFKAKLDILLPIKESLNEKLKKLNENIKESIVEEVTEYAKTNLKTVYLADFVIENNKDYNSIVQIIVTVPFEPIFEEISLTVPCNLTKIIKKDDCVKNINSDENESKIYLSCLPTKGTLVEAIVEGKLETTETEEILFASNKESLLKRNINLLNLGNIPKALIHTAIPAGTTKFIVLNNGKEITAYKENTTLSFILQTIQNEDTTTIFFYIEGLILTTTTNYTTPSVEKTEINYTVVAQNTITKNLVANLILDIPFNSNVEEITIIKNENELVVGKPQIDKLVLNNQKFNEKETINYKIQVIVNNAFEYYLEELQKQREELLLFGEIKRAKIIQELTNKGEKNNLKILQTTFEENAILLQKLNTSQEEAFAQQSLKQKVLDKIEELRMQIEELNTLGLEKEAKETEGLIQTILALDFNTPTNIAKAFDALSKKTFSFDNTLKETAAALGKKVEEINKNRNFKELNDLTQKFFEEKQKFDESISFDFIEGKIQYLKMEETYAQIVSIKESYDLNIAKSIKITQKGLAEIKEKNSILINLLEDYFLAENNLTKNKIIPPITQSRLAKLKLDNSDINFTNLSLEEQKQKLLKINEELENAINYLKRESILAFNKGIDLSLSTQTLTKAKEAIDQNNYASALFLLSNAITQNQNPLTSNYVLFVPILLIVVLAFVLKKVFEKKDKLNEETKKSILEEWEE